MTTLEAIAASDTLANNLANAFKVTVIPTHAAERIDDLQKFLLASDWNSLSQLDLVSSQNKAASPSASMSDDTLFASIDTLKQQSQPVDAASESDPIATPPLRSPFEGCYSDSAGSPDSSRDFLTSPSLFNNVDFEFDSDNPANNFPLFSDQSFESEMTRAGSESGIAHHIPVSDYERSMELRMTDQFSDSQTTEAPFFPTQSTIVPSQIKAEEPDFALSAVSSLDAAFASAFNNADTANTPSDLMPYYTEDEVKDTADSTLAMAFAQAQVEAKSEADDSSLAADNAFEADDDSAQNTRVSSRVGPMRYARAKRQSRASPIKHLSRDSTTSMSPAPHAHPTDKTKKWQCTSCGKWFDRAYNLKTHLFTHENPELREKPYECPDKACRKPFARKHDMKRHFDNVHRGESRRSGGSSLRNDDADDLG